MICEKEDCNEPADKNYKPLCYECGLEETESAYESFLEGYYGGSQAVTLNEQINEARKL